MANKKDDEILENGVDTIQKLLKCNITKHEEPAAVAKTNGDHLDLAEKVCLPVIVVCIKRFLQTTLVNDKIYLEPYLAIKDQFRYRFSSLLLFLEVETLQGVNLSPVWIKCLKRSLKPLD